MGGSTAGIAEIDFALIGHQESWRAAADVLAFLRGPMHTPLPEHEVRDILPWIPPRAACHVEISSTRGAKARGVYIDSFIPPDRLGDVSMRDNLARVRAAAACAIKAGAKIVSLGGFSSILIEGNVDHLPQRHGTVFTTGNTLTVSFIIQGVRQLCLQQGRDLHRSTLLIVGATGDVGFRLRPLSFTRREARAALRPQPGAVAHAGFRVDSQRSASRDRNRSAAILRICGCCDLRSEPSILLASVGRHRHRRNHL